ncbi:MAG: hypothetical protein ABW196_01410 [Solirubrobacterales bacterium]
MNEEVSEAPKPAVIEIRGKVQQPPRSDGYRPITDPQWVWGQMLGVPSREAWRTFWSAARRLDTGHRQIERIREAIEDLPPLGSPAGRQAAHEVIGDAELAIWALDKALDIAVGIQGRYRIPGTFPAIIKEKRPLVAALRDHWSHIDERALGKVMERDDPTAENAFEYVAIISRREFTDGTDSLGIDEESTDLCIATRDYLVRAWGEITAEAHNKRQAQAG